MTGQFIKGRDKIVKVAEESTSQVSLSDVPNYVEFSSAKTGGRKKTLSLKVKAGKLLLEGNNTSKLLLTITSGIDHKFYATNDKKHVNSNTFLVNEQDVNITAENIKVCLMKNNFIGSNFELSVPFAREDNEYMGGDIINLVSLGAGSSYNFTTRIAENTDILSIEANSNNSTSDDAIDKDGTGNVNIELDVYTNTGLKIGESIFTNQKKEGVYYTTLHKGYFKQPVWFNLNSAFGNTASYSNAFLNAAGWCDPGTVKDFRFVAYINDKAEKKPFYISDIFHVIKGYKRNLEQNDLKDYIYDFQKMNVAKPLTTQPSVLSHIKGQTQYFNCLVANGHAQKDTLNIIYRVYTQSKLFIAEMSSHSIIGANLTVANTAKLAIDECLTKYSNAGVIDVYLAKDNIRVSEILTFNVLPECLHSMKDFAFLNSLGGWSSYAFLDSKQVDFKASANSIFKTQTPKSTVSSDLESVYNKEVDERFTVQTMPIKPEVADWLKELSASEAVYELSTKRYVIVDDMKIKHSNKDELVRVEMKYKYSDSFNGKM